MTNTKLRKRALLSSVAMLLVALIALGSATFAWFAENPNVSATGLTIKTTASDGLEIYSESEQVWGTSANLHYDKTNSTPIVTAFNLTPATQAQNVKTEGTVTGKNGNKFFTTKATGAGAYGSGTNTFSDASAGMTSADEVYAEKLYFRLSQTSSETASRNVKLTGITLAKPTANQNSNLYKALRVSICDSSNEILGTYYPSGAGMNGAVTADAKDAAIGTVGTPFEPAATAAASTGLTTRVASGVSKSSNTTDATKEITVYIWLDGQDNACFTQNVAPADVTAFLQSVTLSFSLEA